MFALSSGTLAAVASLEEFPVMSIAQCALECLSKEKCINFKLIEITSEKPYYCYLFKEGIEITSGSQALMFKMFY